MAQSQNQSNGTQTGNQSKTGTTPNNKGQQFRGNGQQQQTTGASTQTGNHAGQPNRQANVQGNAKK